MSSPACLKFGITPRLLSKSAAASYCGMRLSDFAETYPGRPIRSRDGSELYDRALIDQWLDRLSGMSVKSSDPREIVGRLRDATKKKTHVG